MSARVRLRSLAKINLDLRVLGKRPDGFHELRTIFQTISLADRIDVEYERGRTKVEIESNLDIPGNLILKAADLVMQSARATGRVKFRLTKRIPMGGGLGGGSTNAAAVLLALPAVLGKRVPFEKLLELAAELGSDVPFFLTGGTALGIGRGAEVYPMPDAPAAPGLLVAPGIHSSTAEAYRALERKPLSEINATICNNFQVVADRTGLRQTKFLNDFETVVFERYPQLKSIKGKLLRLGAWRAMMTGSGSSVFGMFPDSSFRDRAAEWFRKETSYQVFPFATVTRVRYRALWWRQLAISPESRIWPPQDRYAG